LDPARDTELVQIFFERASDYIRLESGQAPTSETTEDFFSGHVPGRDLAKAHKLGVERDNGELTAIIDLGFDFPEKNDAYIGLMLIAPEHRGAGLGRALLKHIKHIARQQEAPRLLLAVLDGNGRGRTFWEREGFRTVLSTEPRRSGVKMHVYHRLALQL